MVPLDPELPLVAARGGILNEDLGTKQYGYQH